MVRTWTGNRGHGGCALLRAPQHADVVTPSSAKVPQSKYDYAPADVLEVAAILADVRNVRDGRNERPDGDRATRSGRCDFAIDSVPVSISG